MLQKKTVIFPLLAELQILLSELWINRTSLNQSAFSNFADLLRAGMLRQNLKIRIGGTLAGFGSVISTLDDSCSHQTLKQ